MLEDVKEYLKERIRINAESKYLYLDLLESNETARIDYFRCVSIESELLDLMFYIESLENKNGSKEGK